jgi:hypothetical protein
VAFKNGQIQESGTHDELLRKQGLYYGLMHAQMGKDLTAEEEEEEDDEFDDMIQSGKYMITKVKQRWTRLLLGGGTKIVRQVPLEGVPPS